MPLALRVRTKVIQIIREEMNKIGAQEMLVPTLHPLELWKETNRNNETGFELMLVKDRRGAEFALGGTAEEMFLDVVRKFRLSYKDLPLSIYQFSTKFRDELRARGGLLRVREFAMKDAYSFDIDEHAFNITYQKMWSAYKKIFDRLSLPTEVVPADVGYIGGKQSHEFVVEADAGESHYFVSEDGSYIAHEDIVEFFREPINQDEDEQEFSIVEQPEWVKTMEDNIKHYKLPPSRFLKNVVYKNRSNGEIIIAGIRGDLDVNKTKLEAVLKYVGQLEEANEEDLEKLGTKYGYVHSWGHTHRDGNKVRYIGDLSLASCKNFIGGQKEETTDSINVNYGRDFECELLADIASAPENCLAKGGKTKLLSKKGIEVGNLFNLEYHYSHKMANGTYTDQEGKERPYYMGSYGIGIERTIAAIVELHHDEKGIIWPDIVSPYKIHLIGLNLENGDIRQKAEELYKLIQENKVEVLFDDREGSTAGEKFADADLIGCPYRIVVSEKTGDKVEIKKRTEKEGKTVTPVELITLLSA